jgi:hypothetical protein
MGKIKLNFKNEEMGFCGFYLKFGCGEEGRSEFLL